MVHVLPRVACAHARCPVSQRSTRRTAQRRVKRRAVSRVVCFPQARIHIQTEIGFFYSQFVSSHLRGQEIRTFTVHFISVSILQKCYTLSSELATDSCQSFALYPTRGLAVCVFSTSFLQQKVCKSSVCQCSRWRERRSLHAHHRKPMQRTVRNDTLHNRTNRSPHRARAPASPPPRHKSAGPCASRRSMKSR
jgi:hypothetical protein